MSNVAGARPGVGTVTFLPDAKARFLRYLTSRNSERGGVPVWTHQLNTSTDTGRLHGVFRGGGPLHVPTIDTPRGGLALVARRNRC